MQVFVFLTSTLLLRVILFDNYLTFDSICCMNTNTITKIGMRKFLRNIKDIKTSVQNGEEFEVLDHSTPVFKVVPIISTIKGKYAFADLSKLQFANGSQTLAKDIDTLVYEK